MEYHMMSKTRRTDVRSAARLVYLSTARRFMKPALYKPEILRISVAETRHVLIESKGYKSLIGSILLAIAMKMVTKLVMKWLDENLFSLEAVPPHYTEGEAGYVARK